jgi:Resolvase, N terminal domain
MSTDHLRVGIYARVSSEQQAKEDTISSQLAAVNQRVASDALKCDPELCFVDDGYSGSTLVRPGLERLRDQAAAGTIDRLYVLDPVQSTCSGNPGHYASVDGRSLRRSACVPQTGCRPHWRSHR